MIRYSLTKDRMNPETGGYIAKVKQSEKTDLDEIFDYMAAEGTGLTRPQAMAYFEKLLQAFEYFTETRGGVNTPLCRIRVSISGVFRNRNDKFDPNRHRIHLRLTPGIRLEYLKNRLKLAKDDMPEHTPSPTLFIDTASQSRNRMATPQSIATLKGRDLKFDPQDIRQGIFFVPENGSANIRVDHCASIKTTEIHFLIPPLPAGNYSIVVNTIMRRHKSIRFGVLQYLITVC